MSYCSFGYNLLGEIVRRVGGLSLPEFAATRLFRPLGMSDTSNGAPETTNTPRLAWSYLRLGSSGPSSGASGGWSTAAGLAVFGQMFLAAGRYGDARILSRPAVTAMTRNQIPGIGAM